MDKAELESNLRQFTGTDGYTRWSLLFRRVVLTDGAFYLAENAGAYWLMDMIASHLPSMPKEEYFAVAKLKKQIKDAPRGVGVNTNPLITTWIFTLEDGNDNVYAAQIIKCSDFPLDEVVLYVGKQGDLWVIMLTSEY